MIPPGPIWPRLFACAKRTQRISSWPARSIAGAACVALLMAAFAFTPRAHAQASGQTLTAFDTGPAVHALCGKPVALLGEPPFHGFGNTLAFKARLVRRLVEECHYKAFFIESGFYDFIRIDREIRAGHDVPDSMISAAIGGIWANKEVQALVPFLMEKARAGALALGGLDDQIGAGTYASHGMASDLAQYLPGEERSRCLAIFERQTLWQYTADAPYGPSDKEKILGCLDEVAGRLSRAKGDDKSAAQSNAMVDSLRRKLARDFTEDDFTKKDQELKWINDRDRSMYLNFRWLLGRLPRGTKVIVWAATVHTAKSLDGIPGFEGRVPLGSWIRHDLGDRSFSLGFSAYSGEYAFVRQPLRTLADAPPSSIEGQAFAASASDSVYLSGKQLREHGPVAARPLGTDFKTGNWEQVLDGLVIFRKERAPQWIQRQKP